MMQVGSDGNRTFRTKYSTKYIDSCREPEQVHGCFACDFMSASQNASVITEVFGLRRVRLQQGVQRDA